MFDGGSTQTFRVLYQQEGSLIINVSLPIADPGYGKHASLHIKNLKELSKYSFIVRSKNALSGQTVESVEEGFMTNGELSNVINTIL